MSNDILTDKGLTHGKAWSSAPTDDGPLNWSMDPNGDLIQGPLDLEFLRGQRVLLSLEPGQIALLSRKGKLLAVYLDGGHTLEIGGSSKQITTDSQLHFLAADRIVMLRWPKSDPVLWHETGNIGVIGRCELAIAGPTSFYREFLAANPTTSAEAILDAMDQAARAALHEAMGSTSDPGHIDHAGLQSLLTRLTPDELSDELASCGLSCTSLAVYTAAPPIEDCAPESAGQFHDVSHN